MFIKQILCQVKHNQKELFSNGQTKWNALKDVEGFIGQFGGWCDTEKDVAYIFSLWDNKNSYHRFMESEHDSIASNANQAGTVTSIKVKVFDIKTKIEGKIHTYNFFINSNYIRFTNSKVKEERMFHFEETQLNLWNNSMSRERGMLGGYFAKNELDKEYLVLTGWSSEDYHKEYSTNTLPRLISESNLKSDIINIDGSHFNAENSWLITYNDRTK
ncbi:YdbC family protein [Shouchella sp. 1P09AA]|uniref:YdbC family protein n=1 Tax=unclassified Shouchella TaxID=2893065 RepID=UPI00399FF630